MTHKFIHDTDIIRHRITRAQHVQDVRFGAMQAYIHATNLDLSHETDTAIRALIDIERNTFMGISLFIKSQYAQMEAAREYERAHTSRPSGKFNRHQRNRQDVMHIIERLAEAALDGAFADM